MVNESWKLKERRRYPRIRVNHSALLTTTEHGIQQQALALGQVLDISPGGVRVDVYPVAEVCTDMPVRVVIQGTPLDVVGRVVYSLPEADKRQVLGIELDEPIKYLCIEAQADATVPEPSDGKKSGRFCP